MVQSSFRVIERAGYKPKVSVKKTANVLRRMQNFLIDLAFWMIEKIQAYLDELDHMSFVMWHGFFNQMVGIIIVAGRDGVQISTSQKKK